MTRFPAGIALLVGGLLCCLVANMTAAERPVALNQLQDRDAKKSTSPRANSERANSERANNDSNPLTAADEAAALAFVKENHGELANLLRVLRNMNEPQYRNAIRDLTRTRMRLEQYRRRSEERYELELQAWKVKSRIQLLTARLHMADSPELRTELKTAFERQSQLRRKLLQSERERIAERLSKIDEQLDRLNDSPSAEAEKQFTALLHRLDDTKRNREKQARPTKPNGSRSGKK